MPDQYYSASAGAILRMGRSTASPLPAPGSDVFDEVPLLGTIGPPGKEIQTGSFNILNDQNKRSVGGKKLDQLLEGDVVIDWTEPVHVAMCADPDVPGGQKRNWQLVYPDQGNRQLDFVAFLSKWTEEQFDSSQDAKEHRAAFTLSVDGAIVAA